MSSLGHRTERSGVSIPSVNNTRSLKTIPSSSTSIGHLSATAVSIMAFTPRTVTDRIESSELPHMASPTFHFHLDFIIVLDFSLHLQIICFPFHLRFPLSGSIGSLSLLSEQEQREYQSRRQGNPPSPDLKPRVVPSIQFKMPVYICALSRWL